MRIAIVNTELTLPRGAQRQLIMFAREWRDKGHDVTIYVGEKIKPYEFDDLLRGLHLVETGRMETPVRPGWKPPGYWAARTLRSRRTMRDLARRVERGGHDVVNAHSHPVQWIASRISAPVVWTCNEPPLWHYYPERPDPVGAWADRETARAVACIAVLDSRMEQRVRAGYLGAKVAVVGSGCELPPLPDAPRSRNLRILSIVGLLHQQKRPLDIVRAAVGAKVAGSELVLVGHENGLGATLDGIASAGGVKLERHNRMSEPDALREFARASAGLFLSENQPWGIFPLECILARVPVVLSDEVGALDVLPDYPYVAKTGDVDAAAAHLRDIAKDPAAASARMEPYASRLEKEYNWAACAQRTLDLLTDARARPRPP